MKKLSINITKAQLVSFGVRLQEGKPEVTAEIALITNGGEVISTYSIRTDGWDKKTTFELPVELLPLIGDTMRILETIVVRHVQRGQLALPTVTKIKTNKVVTKGFSHISDGTEVSIVKINNEPINLDDIPF